MIDIKGSLYSLHTDNTTYSFRVLSTGHLEHLYYGSRIANMDLSALGSKKVSPADENYKPTTDVPDVSLEDLCLEMSSYGKGDIREPFVEMTHADGAFTVDFRFVGAVVSKGKEEFETLPGSYGSDDDIEHLTVTLEDEFYGIVLEMHYYVFPKKDIISRSSKIINKGKEKAVIDRLMSIQLDLPGCDYSVESFHGNWAREMDRHTTPVSAGKFVVSSYTGNTSSRSNTFIMLSKPGVTESSGCVYGFNLFYSGNHYEAFEADSHEHSRLITGINPQNFAWTLEPGESFEAPEAVMTYSSEGFEGISHIMHDFIREHVIRGEWKSKERPILLNSWEAAYFDINEEKLVTLAKAGRDVGIELFVMDDGWFGERDDDHTSLGDWDVDLKKLPGGLSSLADKINELGIDFGLWVEPEMISVKSKLYEAHPDWDMSIPGKPHVEMRWQRILDLTNPEVVDYIADKMTEVFSSANISYVKWDMNRNMTDVFSKYLPAQRQKETIHRYVLGFYQIAKRLNERFPHILFEGCSSGGNRFDLGMLCYFPQIWASDDTDALRRIKIQNGYSYGYPTLAPTTHVSAGLNHQTHRRMPLATRFNVALLGNLGYEVNLLHMNKGELEQVKYQIEFYKKYRKYLQYGDFYRNVSDNLVQWTTVSKDKKYAFVVITQIMVEPNSGAKMFKVPGLNPDATYRISSEPEFYDLMDLDDELERLPKDHPILTIKDKAVTIPAFDEEYVMTGQALTNGGILMTNPFGVSATPWTDPINYFPDFASRLYVLEQI